MTIKLPDKSDNQKVFTRRAFVVGGLQGGLLCLLGTRLAWLQIGQGERYKTLSDKNRINLKIVIPSRGQIVDRYGVPLAFNTQDFRVLVIPEQTENLEKSLRNLASLIDVSDAQIKKALAEAKKSAKFVPVVVKSNLSWEEVSRIEVNIPDLPGLSIDEGEVRNYPYGEATAHIIGYVGAVSKGDVDESDPLMAVPGFKIGKSGIEKTLDTSMRGQSGTLEVEVNVVGREIRELNKKETVPGSRVTLTIDGELQRLAQNLLGKHRSASAVIMDAHTGAVYALASFPSFDPNTFSKGISAAMWEELLANPANPLTNKAVAGQYPPGSTFKMITALAALKTGRVNEHFGVFCPGHFDFGNRRFHCWKKGGHGHVGLIDAITVSCDTYFYTLATMMGIDQIAEAARDFGLGQTYDFDLKEELPGLVPDKSWKQKRYGEIWHPGETINASIGQGYLLATPLQLAVMTSRLVNGGFAVKPWLTGLVGDGQPPEKIWPKMTYGAPHLDLVRQGMQRVVNYERGTAFGSRIKEPGWEMGGKTGTSQVRRITMAQRLAGVKNEDLPWRFRHHALFVAYAPLSQPRYVCAVVVEHGVGGSMTAAPIARHLMIETQRRDPASKPIYAETADRKKEVLDAALQKPI